MFYSKPVLTDVCNLLVLCILQAQLFTHSLPCSKIIHPNSYHFPNYCHPLPVFLMVIILNSCHIVIITHFMSLLSLLSHSSCPSHSIYHPLPVLLIVIITFLSVSQLLSSPSCHSQNYYHLLSANSDS